MARGKRKIGRARQRGSVSGLLGFVVWLTGALVSLAVGFGMIDGVLSVKFIPDVVTGVAGWIVVILTLLGIVLKAIDKVSG